MNAVKQNKYRPFSALMVAMLLFGAVSIAWAETRYISDILIVSLRKGPGPQAEMIRTLKTGTPLELLEEQGDYLRVQTKEGEIGWVPAQYVSDETPKAQVIAWYKSEVEKLKEKAKRLEKRISDLNQEMNKTGGSYSEKINSLEEALGEKKKEAEKLSAQLTQITAEHSDLVEKSGSVIELSNERDRLSASNEKLGAEVDHLRSENTRLMRTGMIWWFLAGGGVFLFGWLAGKRSRKKKYL